MLRRLFRTLFTVGIVAAAAAAVSKLLGARQPAAVSPPKVVSTPKPAPPWPPLQPVPAVEDRPEVATTRLLPDPDAPPAHGAAATTTDAWVDPEDGVCPASHPVKAKLSSKIFHLPGMMNYDRTNPDRCYRDAAAAEADGLRPAKR